MARPKKTEKAPAKKKLKLKEKAPAKKTLKTKEAPKKTEVAPPSNGNGKRGPGRPPTKKPVVGYEISNKDQNKIGTVFADIQKQFDSIANNVSQFAFDATPKAAVLAVKEIVVLNKNLNNLKKTIRTVKENLKPKYGELQQAA